METIEVRIPKARAQVTRDEYGNWQVVVRVCPYCQQRHTLSGGNGQEPYLERRICPVEFGLYDLEAGRGR